MGNSKQSQEQKHLSKEQIQKSRDEAIVASHAEQDKLSHEEADRQTTELRNEMALQKARAKKANKFKDMIQGQKDFAQHVVDHAKIDIQEISENGPSTNQVLTKDGNNVNLAKAPFS